MYKYLYTQFLSDQLEYVGSHLAFTLSVDNNTSTSPNFAASTNVFCTCILVAPILYKAACEKTQASAKKMILY